MGRVLTWIFVIICVVIAYQAGLFQGLFSYFENSANKMQEETVTENPDGSITKVKYKNVFNVIFDKE